MNDPLVNQRGAVLVVGLLILVVLSMLGITTMQMTTLEEKMANNMGQRQLAFQAAEAGLREAEGRLAGLGGIDPSLPVLTPAAPGKLPVWNTANRWSGTNSEAGTGLDAKLYAEQPRYVVELLQEIPVDEEVLDADVEEQFNTMYRVTARGVGGVDTAEVILQITHLQ